MSFEEIKDYIGKKVILTDIDGRKFRGEIFNTESKYDTSSGKDEVEIRVKDVWYGIPFDEIKAIVEIV